MTRVTGGNEAIATHQTLRTSMKAARSSCGRYRAKIVVVFGTVPATETRTVTDSLEWPKEINPLTLSLDFDITPQSFRGGSRFPFRNLHSPHDVIKKNVHTLRNS
jgi:hypothetical protein